MNGRAVSDRRGKKSGNLAPRIHLLPRGRGYHWNGWYYERAKYINKFKNIPRYSPKEAYLELGT